MERMKSRRQFWEKHPEAIADQRTRAMADLSAPDLRTYLKRCIAWLDGNKAETAGAMHVLIMGGADTPAVDFERAEPTIVSPSSSPLVSGLALFIAMGVIAMFAVAFPSPRLFSRTSVPCLVVVAAGGVSGVVWWWVAMVRPRYVRFAPGIVETLRYRPFSRRPIIERTSLDGSAYVFVLSNCWLIWRDGWKARIITTNIGKDDRQRIWSALLSTAPTPPLDDERLIG